VGSFRGDYPGPRSYGSLKNKIGESSLSDQSGELSLSSRRTLVCICGGAFRTGLRGRRGIPRRRGDPYLARRDGLAGGRESEAQEYFASAYDRRCDRRRPLLLHWRQRGRSAVGLDVAGRTADPVILGRSWAVSVARGLGAVPSVRVSHSRLGAHDRVFTAACTLENCVPDNCRRSAWRASLPGKDRRGTRLRAWRRHDPRIRQFATRRRHYDG
jgi:hypothetical protein